VTWAELFESGKVLGRPVVVSLLKAYFCPDTGAKLKRGMRFNIDANGELWLKESKSIKWQYEPAIKVKPDAEIPETVFFVEVF